MINTADSNTCVFTAAKCRPAENGNNPLERLVLEIEKLV